jgi:hypothetical protein
MYVYNAVPYDINTLVGDDLGLEDRHARGQCLPTRPLRVSITALWALKGKFGYPTHRWRRDPRNPLGSFMPVFCTGDLPLHN